MLFAAEVNLRTILQGKISNSDINTIGSPVFTRKSQRIFLFRACRNCWFRTMVEEQMDNYANARTKTDKSLVVSVLVNRVRAANPQGGFVKNYGGQWYRVSDRYSREKVGQQFR